MKSTDYLGMLGGLALFLYGMQMMSDGLEQLAGHYLETILKKLTNHKLKAIGVGIIITALIQSSSAMTVMLVGFVNSGLMPLENAIWVVMGANIGTTVTGQLLAFPIGSLAPVLSLIGIVLFIMSKHIKAIGSSIGGIGLLFMGLEMMSLSLSPLKNSAFFIQCLHYFTHPLFGILVGAFFTAIIQSSSASIGILQSLAKLGFLTLKQATFLIFGFDIGTCVTAFLASLTGSRAGKQVALFHLLLNLFGTFIFTIIVLTTPFITFVYNLTPNLIMTQIANMHTLFNVGTTLMALCIDHYFIKIVKKILPSR